MMMSMDYNIPQLLTAELKEIRSFHFYRLINPNQPDLISLGKGIHVCSDPQEECRLVPGILFTKFYFLPICA